MNNKFLCNSDEIDLSSTLDGGQSFRWHKFENGFNGVINNKPYIICLLYTSPSQRDRTRSRMPSSA